MIDKVKKATTVPSFSVPFVFANAARGKRKKLGLDTESESSINQEITLIDDLPAKKTFRKSWQRLIYKIYEVNPLKCPCCGSGMKIIAFIRDYQQIKKILKHIGLWPVEYPMPPPKTSPIYTELPSKLAASMHLN